MVALRWGRDGAEVVMDGPAEEEDDGACLCWNPDPVDDVLGTPLCGGGGSGSGFSSEKAEELPSRGDEVEVGGWC